MIRPAYRPDTTEPDRVLLRRYAAGDPAAFAQLLDRHGPLVLGACRRAVGGHAHAAEDAFQATFLVLARKAAGLRDPDSLPGWLFGVARRVAAAARRRDTRHERASRAGAKPEAVPAGKWDDLLAVVDEEIAALPDDLRAAVLPCLYHGKTQDEAAAELGWTLSTLRRRLDRGRELLRSRLTTRGVAPAVALVAGAVAPSAVSALPPQVRAATLDLAAGGTAPAGVTELARGGAPAGLSPAWVVAGVTAVGVAVGAAAWFGSNHQPPSPAPATASMPEPPKPEVLPALPAAPLPPRAIVRLGTTRFRHGTDGAFGLVDPLGVTRLGFLPDGTLTSVGGGRVRFWDAATGVERDGPGVAVGSRWVLRAVPFDAGRRLLVPEQDAAGNLLPAARVWTLVDRRAGPVLAFARHTGRKGDVIGPTAVSADGTRFAQTDGNGDGWLWHADCSTGAKLAGKVREHGPAAFLPGGGELVTACPDGSFRVWDAADGKELRAFGDPAPHIAAAASADGTRVAVVGEDPDPAGNTGPRQVVVWDTARGTVVRRFPLPGLIGFVAGGGAVAFTPDGRHVAAVGHVRNRTLEVRWWALDGNGSGHWTAMSEGTPPQPLAVANDLRTLAVGSGSGSARGVIRVFDGVTGVERVPPDGMPGPVQGVAFAAGGSGVVTTDHFGRLATWDVTTGKQQHLTVTDRQSPPETDVGFDVPAALGLAGPLGPQQPGVPPAVVKSVAVSADGSRVAVGVATFPPGQGWGRVYVLNRATRAVLWSAPVADAAVTSLAFSPDGSRLAVGTTVVRVFAAATGAGGLTLDGHRGAVTALGFSADGKRLASGATDATAVLWNVE
ncbi:sigma-70 family RNA polymerase sigma factor [Urbifossiella limnaea]|uniref:ECF RNA polymerase sigma factor SigE n=1 Tax=Urbifossiella limnaea TaxID=2528023 RepID=A0A517XXG0_9BACT|nr:sigma-70 family RNA polymerase sigma factor [Urbifossiella limnaea]QDU22151.1 ECF RNA polymerase sigma factor SigE [Urbifossiella limnaea]